MAKPGPKPKPTVLKLAAGNPGRRPLNEREPQPTPGIPDAPAWLDDVARACWMRTAGELHRLGVLTMIDGDALAAYCVAWSEFCKARDFVAANGQTYYVKDKDGKPKVAMQWPQVSILRNMMVQVLRYQQEFGLTPSSRTGIRAIKSGGGG